MAEDPSEAGAPRTRDATRVYDDGRLQVEWDATRCIHTAICLQRLPAVFDVHARPWIDLGSGQPEEIAATIRACPTGALRYAGPAVPPEAPDEPTTVEVRPNGPLFLRGRLILQGPGRAGAGREETRLALCRCGASENKPYCDNSHRLIEFRAPGSAGAR